LHPAFNVVPFAVIVTVLSKVQVTVLETVLVLLHPSLAVNVLVCVLEHPLLCKAPSIEVIVVEPQASVADAVPSAALISEATGLHPRASVVPFALIVGGVRSAVHETVRDVVEVLPHPSVAVKILVCEAVHPTVLTGPSDDVIVGAPQASVAVAVANAVLIAVDVGLHPRVTREYVPVNAGGVTSSVHVTVRDTVAVLPHASVAVNVLICDLLQVPVTIPSFGVMVGVLQLSVAVALPNAAVIADDPGLQPSDTVK
jgi:hypothetical protein